MSSQDIGYTRATRSEKKESAALEGVNGAVGIRNGVQCVNWAVDQNTVIFLLNRIPSTAGGALFPSGPTRFKETRNGFCDPQLSQAIRRFQSANGLRADGVVDPGGPTASRMRKLSTGVRPQSGESLSEGEQDGQDRLIDNLQQLIDGLQLLARQLAGTPQGTELGKIALELEHLLSQNGIPRRPGSLPVRNAALVEIIVVVVAVCGLILIAIVGVQSSPTQQKNEKDLVGQIIEGVNVRVRRAQELLFKLLLAIFGTLADGLARINQVASRIVQSKGTCKEIFEKFEKITSQLVFALTLPGTPFPGRFRAGELPEVVTLAKNWLQAFIDLIGCLEEAGFPLIRLLNAPTKLGFTIVRLIELLIGGGNLPNIVRRAL